MASAVYSEPPGSRLSISLEGEACASPFPSPSSSFLPPPTPGAHEFAVKPAPPARNGRKSSAAHISNPPPPREAESISGDTASLNSETKLQRSSLNGVQGHPIHPNGYGSSLLPTSKESSSPAPSSPSLLSPTTPTPYTFQHQPAPMNNLEPPRSPTVDQSTSSSTTPTILTTALPPADTPGPSALDAKKQSGSPSKIIIPDTLDAAASSTSASGPSSPAFSSFGSSSRPISASINADPSLFSNRPAPPSPAMSRRVSGAPSMSSTRSKSSRPPSQVVSRANSLRKSTSRSTRGSPVINPHRQSLGTQLSQSFAPLPSPQKLIFALSVSSASTSMSTSSAASPSASSSLPVTPASLQKRVSAVVYIKIRDFGFPASDERHIGLGPDVPKPNKVGRMNRRLGGRTLSQGSVESSDGDGEEEVDDDVDGWGDNGVGGGWDGFRMGLGRFSWNTGGAGASSNFEAPPEDAGHAGFPSQMDLNKNFLEGDSDADQEDEEEDEEEEYFDAHGDGEDEEEDTLYPGLYRALYAFEPEGTAEMRLDEDQIVRVVGRGGGVGWAVVIDEKAMEVEVEEAKRNGGLGAPKHALVPESYLEPVRLDWEDEEAAVVAAAIANAMPV